MLSLPSIEVRVGRPVPGSIPPDVSLLGGHSDVCGHRQFGSGTFVVLRRGCSVFGGTVAEWAIQERSGLNRLIDPSNNVEHRLIDSESTQTQLKTLQRTTYFGCLTPLAFVWCFFDSFLPMLRRIRCLG